MTRSLVSVPLAHRVAAIACASVVLVAGCSGSTASPKATSAAVGSPGASSGASAGASARTSPAASAGASSGASAQPSSTTTGGLRLPEPDKTPALEVVDVT